MEMREAVSVTIQFPLAKAAIAVAIKDKARRSEPFKKEV
jgi:hypothetical protein